MQRPGGRLQVRKVPCVAHKGFYLQSLAGGTLNMSTIVCPPLNPLIILNVVTELYECFIYIIIVIIIIDQCARAVVI